MNEIYKTFNTNDVKSKEVTTHNNSLIPTGNNGYAKNSIEDNDYYDIYEATGLTDVYVTYLTKAVLAPTTKANYNYLRIQNLLLGSSTETFFTGGTVDANITMITFERDKIFDGLSTNEFGLSGYTNGTTENTNRGERLTLTDGTDITGYVYLDYGIILLKADITAGANMELLLNNASTVINCKKKSYQSIFICKVDQDEFNFTNNKSAIDSDGIYIDSFEIDDPTVYVTGIGLYDSNNKLIAIGKFSKPITKNMVTPLVFSAILEI